MMTRKQLKALKRHKEIVRKRNIRTNNLAVNPNSPVSFGTKHSYRLYDI